MSNEHDYGQRLEDLMGKEWCQQLDAKIILKLEVKRSKESTVKSNLIGNYRITGTQAELQSILAQLARRNIRVKPQPTTPFAKTELVKINHLHINGNLSPFRVTCETGPVPERWGQASIGLLPWRTIYLPSGREHRAECILDATEFCEILNAKRFNSIPTRYVR